MIENLENNKDLKLEEYAKAKEEQVNNLFLF